MAVKITALIPLPQGTRQATKIVNVKLTGIQQHCCRIGCTTIAIDAKDWPVELDTYAKAATFSNNFIVHREELMNVGN